MDIQRAKAAYEEETEFYVGFDPGADDGYCIVGVREGEVKEVYFHDFAKGGTNIIRTQWLEDPPGRFRALYLALQSGLRKFGRYAVLWLRHKH